MSTVRYRSDELPPMSEERKKELMALSEASDSEIDYRDIQPLEDSFWERAVPNPFFKPVKTHVSIRIDADIIAWFKRSSNGRGYQSLINAALRKIMLAEIKDAKHP